ncbi:MAG: NADH-quinone oxidoreductase subunit NuoE [Hyphomicrobium sp.]
MAVRRLHPEQPATFAFSAENQAWAERTIANYPPGKQASAIIPLLWRAQEQNSGWLSEPAIRAVCDRLGMAYIRGLEIATFYTMFQLAPVGSKAHVQVCGTTPCMLNGARALVDVCKRRIAEHPHELSFDGLLSWEEVECLGNCANAPVVQVGRDTFEDLTPSLLEAVIDGFVLGKPPKAGSQIGRTASCPADGPTTLRDPSLYDGSTIGAWRKRFEETGSAQSTSPAAQTPATSSAPSQPHPAALAAIANAGLVKDFEARGGGKPLSFGELDKLKLETGRFVTQASRPELLAAPRGAPDDLGLIWGVGDVLAKRLNAMGVWHFEQIANWTPANVAWFEDAMDGFKGRVTRDKWIEQCQKLAAGWRPESGVGERPKD